MYKCTECGSEYEIKPDFCDCGNDEFKEVLLSVTVEKVESQNVPQKEIVTPKAPKSIKRTLQFEPISLAIFIFCILISFYVIFFAWNVVENEIISEKTDTLKTTANIPSINTFWNNSLPEIKKEEIAKLVEIQKPEPQKTINTVKTVQPKQTAAKTVKNTVSKPSVSNTNKKTTQKTQPKPAKTTVQTSSAPTQSKQVQQNVTNNTSSQKPVQEVKKQEQPKVVEVQKPAVDTQALKRELDSYKISLRNTIGRKIDFTQVIGDGECIISFKINSSGVLTNRAFKQQSTNITLNDAVYKAFMATPSYNPPPQGYKNETLNLKVSFYNGNFQVSLY